MGAERDAYARPTMTEADARRDEELPTYRYDARLANEIEAKWQDRWESRAHLLGPEPVGAAERGLRRGRGPHEALRARHVPVPERRGAPRRPSPRVHRHRRLRPLQADDRAQRPARDGLRRVRAPGRAVRGADRASTRGSPPRRTSRTCAASCARSGSVTTRAAASRRPTPRTTDGRSGSSCSCSTPGTTRTADRARPIAELIPRLEADPEVGWAALSARERRELVDANRLAYLDEAPVNWCPALGTVLANEEVTPDGRSERGNHPVYRRPLKQWMLRITAYAERLLADLDLLDWTDSIKLMQRNWIGRSVGAEVDFGIEGHEDTTITVFTTRPDTLFGATYMVLAPEHPLVDAITPAEWPGASLGEDINDIPVSWRGIFGSEAGPAEAVRRYREFAAQQERARASGRRPGEDRRLHRRVRDQPGQRPADPDLRRRLRADGLRHRRDHGRPRARPARLRVRAGVRPADPLRSSSRRRLVRGARRQRPTRRPPSGPRRSSATASR